MKLALTSLLAVLPLFTTSPAHANGRFPRGEHLFEDPNDPDRLLLAATYGLISTEDRGKNWYYICESAFSFFPPDGFSEDPLVALTSDGRYLASVQERVTISSDRECGWTTVLEVPKSGIDDIAASPSNRNDIVALVRNATTSATLVYESTDGGLNWAPIGTPLPVVVSYTIDVDPKDPKHLMATGITSFDALDSGVFLDSKDHGTTWTTSPIPKTNIYVTPYIAAVHPTDSKKIFVRVNEWVDDGAGGTSANDALLYSKDGGQTWTEILRPVGADGVGAKLFGFALSPDGATVLAGFGDPVNGGGQHVDPSLMGVYKSSEADYTFGMAPKAIFEESATCITWTNKGIYVCGSPDGMTSYISFAPDVSMLSNTGLKKIMQVDQLRGPSPCCAGRARSACTWSVDCLRFSACGDNGGALPPPDPDASACVNPPPDGGMGGGAGASGAGAGGTGTRGSGGGDSGCNCRMTGSTRAMHAQGLGLLLVVTAGGCWRRSHRRRTVRGVKHQRRQGA